jgi:hypothetical protein
MKAAASKIGYLMEPLMLAFVISDNTERTVAGILSVHSDHSIEHRDHDAEMLSEVYLMVLISAMRTTSESDFASSFSIMLARCSSTVLKLINSSRAISLLRRPATSSSMI